MAPPKPPGLSLDTKQDPLLPPRASAPPKSEMRPARNKNNGAPTTAEQTLAAALEASQQTSTSLSGLLEALGKATSGIEVAQQANEHLKSELTRLRHQLEQEEQHSARLRDEVSQLQALLEEARHFDELEHRYVRDEQDRFIAALMDEYEEQLTALRQSPQHAPTVTQSQGAIQELSDALAKAEERVDDLLTERERTRAMAQRAQRQRDEAQQEVTRLGVELRRAQSRLEDFIGKVDDRHTRPTEPPPGPPPAGSPRALSAQRAAQSAKPTSHTPDLGDFEQAWDADAIPAPPPSLDVEDGMTARALRNSAPPLELQAALTSPDPQLGEHIPGVEQLPVRSAASQNLGHAKNKNKRKAKPGPTLTMPRARPSGFPTEPPPSRDTSKRSTLPPTSYRLNDKPPLKRKLDHSMRPLVGYSKSASEIEPEQFRAQGRARDREA